MQYEGECARYMNYIVYSDRQTNESAQETSRMREPLFYYLAVILVHLECRRHLSFGIAPTVKLKTG